MTNRLQAFMSERAWNQFHTERNLAQSISIEAAELLERFQWNSEPSHAEVADELADVLTYCYLLADKLGKNPQTIILDKLAVTAEKYPVEKSYGRSTKYDRL